MISTSSFFGRQSSASAEPIMPAASTDTGCRLWRNLSIGRSNSARPRPLVGLIVAPSTRRRSHTSTRTPVVRRRRRRASALDGAADELEAVEARDAVELAVDLGDDVVAAGEQPAAETVGVVAAAQADADGAPQVLERAAHDALAARVVGEPADRDVAVEAVMRASWTMTSCRIERSSSFCVVLRITP